jgi:hypothetical protein
MKGGVDIVPVEEEAAQQLASPTDLLRESVGVLEAAGIAYDKKADAEQRDEAFRLYTYGNDLLDAAMQSPTSTQKVKDILAKKARGVQRRIDGLKAAGAGTDGTDDSAAEEAGAVRIGGSEWTENLKQFASEDEETTEKEEFRKKFNEIEEMYRMKMDQISKRALYYETALKREGIDQATKNMYDLYYNQQESETKLAFENMFKINKASYEQIMELLDVKYVTMEDLVHVVRNTPKQNFAMVFNATHGALVSYGERGTLQLPQGVELLNYTSNDNTTFMTGTGEGTNRLETTPLTSLLTTPRFELNNTAYTNCQGLKMLLDQPGDFLDDGCLTKKGHDLMDLILKAQSAGTMARVATSMIGYEDKKWYSQKLSVSGSNFYPLVNYNLKKVVNKSNDLEFSFDNDEMYHSFSFYLTYKDTDGEIVTVRCKLTDETESKRNVRLSEVFTKLETEGFFSALQQKEHKLTVLHHSCRVIPSLEKQRELVRETSIKTDKTKECYLKKFNDDIKPYVESLLAEFDTMNDYYFMLKSDGSIDEYLSLLDDFDVKISALDQEMKKLEEYSPPETGTQKNPVHLLNEIEKKKEELITDNNTKEIEIMERMLDK